MVGDVKLQGLKRTAQVGGDPGNNPKPRTLNRKPQTLNPKPQTLNPQKLKKN